jgi:hypothetical protein
MRSVRERQQKAEKALIVFPSAPRITVSNVHYTLSVYNLFLSAAQDFACLRHRVSFKKFSACGQNSHLRIEMRAAAAATNPVGPCTLFLWTACVSLCCIICNMRAMYIIIVIWALNIASCVWLPYWCTLAALAQKRYAKRVRPHVHSLFSEISLYSAWRASTTRRKCALVNSPESFALGERGKEISSFIG